MSQVIVVDGLTKAFADRLVVKNLSFSVERGEIFGFIGPNGSGKTTTIKMLCGLLNPTTGTAYLNGLDIRQRPKEVRLSIGYMSQQFGLYRYLTVEQNLDFYAKLYGLSKQRAQQRKVEVLQLTGLINHRQKEAAHLSGGWRQRLALACALVHEPTVVFLDEPTAGVDPVARRALWDLVITLARDGTTFFVTTHYTDEVERCDAVGYIYMGKLIAYGTPAELRSLPSLRQANHRRLEVVCQDAERVYDHLRGLDFVVDASITGQSVHVLVPQAMTISHLEEQIAAASLPVTDIHTVKPSLEDIFVTLTELEESGNLSN